MSASDLSRSCCLPYRTHFNVTFTFAFLGAKKDNAMMMKKVNGFYSNAKKALSNGNNNSAIIHLRRGLQLIGECSDPIKIELLLMLATTSWLAIDDDQNHFGLEELCDKAEECKKIEKEVKKLDPEYEDDEFDNTMNLVGLFLDSHSTYQKAKKAHEEGDSKLALKILNEECKDCKSGDPIFIHVIALMIKASWAAANEEGDGKKMFEAAEGCKEMVELAYIEDPFYEDDELDKILENAEVILNKDGGQSATIDPDE